MTNLSNFFKISLAAGLLSSCFYGSSQSSTKSDDRITVEVGVDSKDPNAVTDDKDKVSVEVGVDASDSKEGSVKVDISIDSRPLQEAEQAPEQNPEDNPSGLEEDTNGVFVFVDRQGADIKLSMAAREGADAIEICLGEKEDCLANKEGLQRFIYRNKTFRNQRVFFENYRGPSIDTVWTIFAKDSENKSLYYRAVKID